MACNGTYCNAYGTGTSTCVGHRDSCATNRVLSMSGEFTGGRVLASDIEQLRSSIVAELNTYSGHAGYGPYNILEPNSFVSGGTVYASQYNNMQTMINYVESTSWPGAAQNSTIYGSYWQNLKNNYDVLRQDCICNSDCSCNAVCSCHNDCGCNYSDERLKENIIFLGQKSGLNIYSFTYLWDKTKTYIGVMAQELLKTDYAHAVTTDNNGYYMVNYSKLPI